MYITVLVNLLFLLCSFVVKPDTSQKKGMFWTVLWSRTKIRMEKKTPRVCCSKTEWFNPCIFFCFPFIPSYASFPISPFHFIRLHLFCSLFALALFLTGSQLLHLWKQDTRLSSIRNLIFPARLALTQQFLLWGLRIDWWLHFKGVYIVEPADLGISGQLINLIGLHTRNCHCGYDGS